MTITTSRPGKRVSAAPAPNGTAMSPPNTTADKLTTSDDLTIASSAGSLLAAFCGGLAWAHDQELLAAVFAFEARPR